MHRLEDKGMPQIFNDLGQPVGHALPDWKPPPVPPHEAMEGRFCRLEALVPQRHAEDLYAVNTLDTDDRNWTYLPYGPFDSFKSYRTWMETSCQSDDPLFFAIIPKSSGTPAGVASYLRRTTISGLESQKSLTNVESPCGEAGVQLESGRKSVCQRRGYLSATSAAKRRSLKV